MSRADREAAARRLRLALDMHDTGVQMMRQKLRRQHPDASPAEISRLLRAWLYTRPGAERGDVSST